VFRKKDLSVFVKTARNENIGKKKFNATMNLAKT
jgi:hypothetical protein